ncbi:MAG TPA: DUF2019 domain-containing protein [Pseudolabrys sp.]|nr:DUF2019 domain-containing protein [Pseudolabrys sp.]
MKRSFFESMPESQLVEQFTNDALKQFEAELNDEFTKYNALADDIVAIGEELKRRTGDKRSALLPLFDHPNPQVRLMAAEITLAVAPAAARQILQEIWDRKEFPQAAHAMGTLRALERGDRKPT